MNGPCAQESKLSNAVPPDRWAPAREAKAYGSAIYNPFSVEVRAERPSATPSKKQTGEDQGSPDLIATLFVGVTGGAALVWLLRR